MLAAETEFCRDDGGGNRISVIIDGDSGVSSRESMDIVEENCI